MPRQPTRCTFQASDNKAWITSPDAVSSPAQVKELDWSRVRLGNEQGLPKGPTKPKLLKIAETLHFKGGVLFPHNFRMTRHSKSDLGYL